MNRTVRYIFNENFTKKKKVCEYCEQCMGPTENFSKKKKNNEMQTLNVKRYIQTNTKQSIIYIYIYFKNVKREY